jgi:tRNA pseudouridine13 synthase
VTVTPDMLANWTKAPWTALNRITADIVPVAGLLKSVPEDFEVEEIPDGPLSGSGEHLYVWLEKRDLAAHLMLQRLQRVLNVDAREIGTAGMKDARAVTRQHVSLPARVESRLSQIEDANLRVLRTERHDQKLKTGHAQGNSFRVRVRGVPAVDVPRAKTIVDKLTVTGVPNYFGAQRFGRDGSTLALGRRLFAGEKAETSGMLTRLALSAVQSSLFNACLAARIADGLFTRVLRGDVIADRKLAIVSVAIDAEAEEERSRAGRVTTLGPMFGPKMREARHEVAEREAAVLAAAGLTRASFMPHRNLVPGTRRPYRIWLDAPSFETIEDGFTVRFTLPAGAYATVVLNEVVQNGVTQVSVETDDSDD